MVPPIGPAEARGLTEDELVYLNRREAEIDAELKLDYNGKSMKFKLQSDMEMKEKPKRDIVFNTIVKDYQEAGWDAGLDKKEITYLILREPLIAP